MDEQAQPGIPVSDASAVYTPATPTPETPPGLATTDQAPAATPTEASWLLHYGGTEPLTKGAYTWQPDQVVAVPESLARTLFGSDNLRVVQDIELFNAMRERPNG